jgi:hypothetical protein
VKPLAGQHVLFVERAYTANSLETGRPMTKPFELVGTAAFIPLGWAR